MTQRFIIKFSHRLDVLQCESHLSGAQGFIRDDIRVNAIMHRLWSIVLYLIHYWQYVPSGSSPVVALYIWVSTARPLRYSYWVYYVFPCGPFCKYIFAYYFLIIFFVLAPFYLAPDGVEIQHVSKCCIFKNCQNVCRLCYIVLYLIHYWAISSPVVVLPIWVSTARYSEWVYYAFPYGPFCKYIFLFFSDHFLCACSMLLRSRIQMSLKYCILKWYCIFKHF